MRNSDDDKNKVRRRKVNTNTQQSRINDNRTNSSSSRTSDNNQSVGKYSRGEISTSNRKVSRKKSKELKKKKAKRIIGNIFIIFMAIIIAGVVSAASLVYAAVKDTTPVTPEMLTQHYISSQVVRSDEIPIDIKNAVVSIEDERFYNHNGVDYISLARALVKNILTGSREGGSTIEMQISKNLLTTMDQTMKRKIKDIYNAIQMNKTMGKQDILEVYLNNIYLGKGCNGIGKAAQSYFNKNISELNLAECATLAGITKNPAKYSTDYNALKSRQETILYKMNELGYISDDEYRDAVDYPLVVNLAKKK